MLERDRRSVITGAAVALLSLGTMSAAGGNEDGDDTRTIHWIEQGGQGDEHATQNCQDGTAYWHWVLTPGGPEPIGEAELKVGFEDDSSDSEEGEPRGEGQGAVHFTVSKEGGGTVEWASVSFKGGGNNPRLVLGEGWCEVETDEGDEMIEEDDNGGPDKGDDESGDESSKSDEDPEEELGEEGEEEPDEGKSTDDEESEEDENEPGDETPDDEETGNDPEDGDPSETDDGGADENEDRTHESDRIDENGSQEDDEGHTHCK